MDDLLEGDVAEHSGRPHHDAENGPLETAIRARLTGKCLLAYHWRRNARGYLPRLALIKHALVEDGMPLTSFAVVDVRRR